jgi:hypothetical protein
MKKLILTSLLGLVSVSFAQDSHSLGLAERRAIKEYQEKTFPGLQAQITQAAGFEVPAEVQWDAIAQPGDAAKYASDDYFTNIYFTPLVDALKKITADDMGKQALKSNLKKVVVTYNKDTAPASNYATGLNFESGTLTINFQPYSNVDDIAPRADAIQKLLESKL